MADLTLTPAEAALFWTRVDKRGPDECWPWLIGTNEHGYGIFQPGGVTLKAHRVAYWLAGDAHGMRKHPERVPRGERNGQAKLTASAVRGASHSRRLQTVTA